MAVTISLDTKLADLKRVGGKSQVLADAATRCQYVNQNTASFLSANDVAEYIDSQGTAVAFEREQSRGVSRLSTLRNFLTLIPLTITWIGFYNISQVTNLDLTTALSTLTPVAAFDIFFFALLIVVGLFADGRTSAVRRNATSAQQTLDSIAHLLTAQLAQRPTADPGNIKQWAQLVQQQLDEVRKVLQETAAETQKTATTTQAVVNQMQSLQQEVNRLAGEAQKLSGAVGGIAHSASQIATSAQGMDTSSRALTVATTAAAAAQSQSNQHLQTVVTTLHSASDAMNKAAAAEDAIPRTLSHLDNNLQAASRNLSTTTRQIEQVERRLASVVRAAGGQHGFGWYLAPWHWGRGGTQVAPQPPQPMRPQWPPATPPQGQVPPTPYNMPPPGQTGIQWQQPYASPPPGQMPPGQAPQQPQQPQQPQNAPGTPGNPVP